MNAEVLPIQHKGDVLQFRCTCGRVISFAVCSQTYPMLVHRTHPGPGITVGACPECGAKHWKVKRTKY